MAETFREVVERAATELVRADPSVAGRRPAPGKWSAKEILGHLIDSAVNNHRRFVLAPGREDLSFAGYDQQSWVEVQSYASADWLALVTLWRAYNLHLAHVMEVIPANVKEARRSKHSLDRIAFHKVPHEQPATLLYLMTDYVAHLEHHLAQIRALINRPVSDRTQ